MVGTLGEKPLADEGAVEVPESRVGQRFCRPLDRLPGEAGHLVDGGGGVGGGDALRSGRPSPRSVRAGRRRRCRGGAPPRGVVAPRLEASCVIVPAKRASFLALLFVRHLTIIDR